MFKYETTAIALNARNWILNHSNEVQCGKQKEKRMLMAYPTGYMMTSEKKHHQQRTKDENKHI